MKKILLCSIILFACIFKLWSQVDEIRTDSYKNAFYIEVGGAGQIYSLNYEHRIPIRPRHRIAAGIGFSKFDILGDVTIGLLSAAYVYGEKHNVEFGTSLGYILDEIFYFVPRIGYKMETSSRYVFRAGFSPLFFPKDYNENIMAISGYVSAGFIF